MAHPARPVELIARGLVVRDGAALLCRNKKSGYCYLPGGHVDPGESSAEALAREFLEECAERVRVGACLAVTEEAFGEDDDRHREINLVFHVELSDHSGPVTPIQSQEKSIEFLWAREAEIPGLDLRPANLKRLVMHMVSRAGQSGGADPAGFSKILWASHLP